MKKKPNICPHCKTGLAVWRGYRYNERTKKRMMLCKKCRRKFTPDDGFFRMRFSPDEIMRAVSLYKKGFSSAEVVLRLKREGIKISRWTVICWARKYGSRVKSR